ncbi:MAG TPA: YciI family protein [Thermoanaerobaculia bacterium]|nr:YciI family protein [Thermoanaerobaculia bacterium]
MKFLTMVKAKEGQIPPPRLMEEIAKLADQAGKDGTMVLTGGLYPSAAGVSVNVSGGELRVVDGPFSEAKEVIGGFAIFELKSKEEAIEAAKHFMELHRKHWPGWEGSCEVRQMFGPDDAFPPGKR